MALTQPLPCWSALRPKPKRSRLLAVIGDNDLKNAQGLSAGGFKEMVKNEKTDEDKFAIECTTNSGKFGFKSRKTVVGRVFSCSRVSSDNEGHECVMKVCASLRYSVTLARW